MSDKQKLWKSMKDDLIFSLEKAVDQLKKGEYFEDYDLKKRMFVILNDHNPDYHITLLMGFECDPVINKTENEVILINSHFYRRKK